MAATGASDEGNDATAASVPTDEDICRVCRGPHEEDNPLYMPCLCSGSISYIHKDCLMTWLNFSKRKVCELCSHSFKLTPKYAPDTPTMLPPQEIITLCVWTLLQKLPKCLRFCFIILSWLAVIPLSTCWIYRMWLFRDILDRNSEDMALSLFNDWASGAVLCIAIMVSFLALISFVDFVLSNEELEEDILDPAQQQQQQQQQPVHNQPALHPAPAGEEGLPPVMGPPDRPLHGGLNGQDGHRAGNDADAPLEAAAVPGGMGMGGDDDGWGAPPPHGFDDQNAIELHLALDELLGLRRNLFTFVQNILWMIMFVIAFTGAFVVLPMFVGASVVWLSQSRVRSARGALLGATSRAANLLLGGHPAEESSPAVANLSLVAPAWADTAEGAAAAVAEATATAAAVVAEAAEATATATVGAVAADSKSVLEDLGLLLLGWSVLGLAVALLSFVAARVYRQLPCQLSRMACRVFRFTAAVLKMIWFLALKILVFPVLFGFNLEYCALPLLARNWSQTAAFFHSHPACSLLLHWVLGVTFMLVVTIFMLELHEVLHPDVLRHLIRLPDPNQHMLRILLNEPATKHMQRMVLSTLIYGSTIFLFLHVPLKSALYLQTLCGLDWIPLQCRLFYPLVELQLPVELVMFYLVALHSIESLKNPLRFLHKRWLEAACYVLHLSGYLLPRPLQPTATEGGDDPAIYRDNVPAAAPADRAREDAAMRNDAAMPELAWVRRAWAQRQRPLAPRDAPPPNVGLRVATLCIAAWLSIMATFVCAFGFSFLIGRGVLQVLTRVTPPHGHDPFALALGFGCLYVCSTIASIVVEHMGEWTRQLKQARLTSVLQALAILLCGVVVAPLLFGCFAAWGITQRIEPPSLQDWALGMAIYASLLLPRQRRQMEALRDAGVLAVFTDPAYLRAVFQPGAMTLLWWGLHACAWAVPFICHQKLKRSKGFALEYIADDADRAEVEAMGDSAVGNADDDSSASCSTCEAPSDVGDTESSMPLNPMALRLGLLSSSAVWIYMTYGTEMKQFVRKVHQGLHQQRYCIGWTLHNHKIHHSRGRD